MEITKQMQSVVDSLTKIVVDGTLLGASYKPQSGEAVIFDRDLALVYATSQDLPDWYDYWTGINEFQQIFPSAPEVRARWSEEEAQSLSELAAEAFSPLREKITEQMADKDLDSTFTYIISGNLEAYLLYEFWFPETGASYWRNFYRIYSQGGMPCGWKGTYPQGELLIFTPWP